MVNFKNGKGRKKNKKWGILPFLFLLEEKFQNVE
jgi:hypothetical protein